ncbi:ArsR/SmtB family transcription factor [Actinoplanes sp. NPDC049681]|uniref:ArsR/SmtB family transcription factor n=1 Tax=Actinoplanes sp. NPDC049681 TaxID=3363905 RepID=UPI0037A6597B
MASTRLVQDAETLKALADPARLAILELMMRDCARTWTAKDLAASVGMPPKKIYYHLNLLEQRGLLEIRATQVVNGIIEKHYGSAQESITFQQGGQPLPDGFRSGGPDSMGEASEELTAVVATLFEKMHATIVDGLRSGRMVMSGQAPEQQRVVVHYTAASMAPERAGQFRDELQALVRRFEAASVPGEPVFELLIATHPRDPEAPAPDDAG